MKFTAIILITAVFLTACGQKGALYLPEKPITIPDDEAIVSTNPNDY